MEWDRLSRFEMPGFLVAPFLEACRLFNTSLDALFYDVQTLVAGLEADGETIVTDGPSNARGNRASGAIDLSALTNPEGALLIVDPRSRPHIRGYKDMQAFLDATATEGAALSTVSITGVGSSALGSAALAWNVAEALGAPVIAVVPGYGVADVILQGLGGFIGFGLHDFLATKSLTQNALAAAAPKVAAVGRGLVETLPECERAPTGAPVFRTGSGSSDVLHALLKGLKIRCVVGHSKGALVIANALRSVDDEHTRDVRVVTLGCPIATDGGGASYHQYLGLFDALGQANAWGNHADRWLPTHHSTNTTIPLSMTAEGIVESERTAA